MTIGVLALQGAFAEHEQMLERLGKVLLKSARDAIWSAAWMA